jgi:hypothetical protein
MVIGGVAKTKYFSKKMPSPGVITPLEIIGQGSTYNMHMNLHNVILYQVSPKLAKDFRKSWEDKVKGTDRQRTVV